jgi:AcrR family transcriptional regulator
MHPAQSPPERRAGRRKDTRERMLAATIALLRQDGVGAISVGRIAKRVGVHHSLFYAHFKNIDACLVAAAQQVLETLAPVDRELRRELFRRAVNDRRVLARYFADSLARWLEQRPFVELLLRHRLDRSALGLAMRPAFDAIRNDLAADLAELARQVGIGDEHEAEVQTIADLHLTHWLWALEALIEKRQASLESLAATLAELFVTLNMSLFARVTRPTRESLIAAAFTPQTRERLGEQQALFRYRLKTHDDASLIAAAGGLEPLVERVLGRFRQYYIPGAAHGASAVVAYRVTYGEHMVERWLTIDNHGCRVHAHAPSEPTRIVLIFSLRTMLETVSATRHLDEAYRAGALRVEGDVFFAAQLLEWFYCSGAAEDPGA